MGCRHLTLVPAQRRRQEFESEGGIRHHQTAVSQAGMYFTVLRIPVPRPGKMKTKGNPATGKETSSILIG